MSWILNLTICISLFVSFTSEMDRVIKKDSLETPKNLLNLMDNGLINFIKANLFGTADTINVF